MERRELILGAGALALGLSAFPTGWATAKGAKRRHILFYTRSQAFEHSVVKRKDGASLGFAEKILTDLGDKHGFDVTCTKDGTVFTPQNLKQYDAFFFYTTGDTTKPGEDNAPPMTAAGKQAFLDAVHSGKGFIGSHCAADTFHTQPDERYKNHGSAVDPYIAMIGGEFIRHDDQQNSTMRVIDSKFPGLSGAGESFVRFEEWYSLKEFSPDLHVILVQETEGMKGPDYQRPPYPATWARKHGKGRVFYTSMGHREEIWEDPLFQSILLGGIAYAVGNVKADVTPNITTAAPNASTLPVGN